MSEVFTALGLARRLLETHPDLIPDRGAVLTVSDSGITIGLFGPASDDRTVKIGRLLGLEVTEFGWRPFGPVEQRVTAAVGRVQVDGAEPVLVEVRGVEERPEPAVPLDRVDADPDEDGPGPEATTEMPLPAQAVAP